MRSGFTHTRLADKMNTVIRWVNASPITHRTRTTDANTISVPNTPHPVIPKPSRRVSIAARYGVLFDILIFHKRDLLITVCLRRLSVYATLSKVHQERKQPLFALLDSRICIRGRSSSPSSLLVTLRTPML